MLSMALVASLGTLALLLISGSSIYRVISSVSGAAILALVVTGLLLTTVAVIRRIRSGGPGQTAPFVVGVIAAYVASAYSVLLITGTVSSLLVSIAPMEFTRFRNNHAVAMAMRPWVVPADSSIDPVAAGAAVLRLAEVRSVPLAVDAPEWAEVARVARAPRVDLLDEWVSSPGADSVDVFDLPFITVTGLKSMAQANEARIDAALARGDRAGARRAAEELLSFGMRLIDGSRSMAHALAGATVVGIGREQLVRTLRASGDPEAARIEAAHTAALEQTLAPAKGERTFGGNAADRSREQMLRSVSEEGPPPLRWEMVRYLAVLPCTDTRTLVFGPDEVTRDVFALVRRDLAQSASDSALVLIAEETPVRSSRKAIADDATVMDRVIWTKARVLGNARIAGCVRGFI